MTSQERILLVDDEQAVLDGLCRQHRKQYTLVPACGPEEGLRAIAEDGPFAVVVTDFQMPGMNGTQFLAKAQEHAPDMIRMMLTGQTDLQTAVEAVNRGHIFRFLNKPCDPVVLRSCLDAALEQYRLRHAEQILLEQTVRGSIEVLADVLALSNPAAFGRARRIRALVDHVVRHLQLTDGWQYETAALLSQIGQIAVPDDLLVRMMAGEELTTGQRSVFDRHPGVARDLLAKIPRLHHVAEMVARQNDPTSPCEERCVALGGRMLAAAIKFEELVSLGTGHRLALETLRLSPGLYDKGVLDALATARLSPSGATTQTVPLRQLRIGMVLEEDVRTPDGNLVVCQGHEITDGSLQRLRNYGELNRLDRVEFRITTRSGTDITTEALCPDPRSGLPTA